MVQGSKTTAFATKILQERLDQQLSRASCLNIRYAPIKSELMQMTAGFKMSKKDATAIRLYDTTSPPKNCLKSL